MTGTTSFCLMTHWARFERATRILFFILPQKAPSNSSSRDAGRAPLREKMDDATVANGSSSSSSLYMYYTTRRLTKLLMSGAVLELFASLRLKELR